MNKEIKQPDIEKLDLDDPFSWALVSRIHARWIKQVGPQLDIDVEKYVLGQVLTDIIGDDSNCFSWTIGDSFFDSEVAFEAKRELIERMDWEANTPETPIDIKDKLNLTLRAVSELDWRRKDEFDQAKSTWFEFKKWVEEQTKKHPELREAEKYRLTMNERMAKHWRKFLYDI